MTEPKTSLIIGRLKISGNHSLPDKTLNRVLDQFQLREGATFDRLNLDSATYALKNAYTKLSKEFARVETDSSQMANDHIGIHIRILEDANDNYSRYKIELEQQENLQRQFKTTVDNPKDPEELQRLRNMNQQGNEMGQGLKAHPIIGDNVKFSSTEVNTLPTMDPEQAEKYQEYQLELANQKRLEHSNAATMKPQR